MAERYLRHKMVNVASIIPTFSESNKEAPPRLLLDPLVATLDSMLPILHLYLRAKAKIHG